MIRDGNLWVLVIFKSCVNKRAGSWFATQEGTTNQKPGQQVDPTFDNDAATHKFPPQGDGHQASGAQEEDPRGAQKQQQYVQKRPFRQGVWDLLRRHDGQDHWQVWSVCDLVMKYIYTYYLFLINFFRSRLFIFVCKSVIIWPILVKELSISSFLHFGIDMT